MATAYAALTSVMNTIEDIKEHPNPPITLDQEQVDSLQETICFLQEFLEAHETYVDHGMEIRIADAARAVEDVIESHIADLRSLCNEDDKICCSLDDFFQNLPRVVQGLDLVKKQVIMEMNDNMNSQLFKQQLRQQATILTSSSQSPPDASSDDMNPVVGIEDVMVRVMDKLTQPHESGRRIIAISGMGGIGKTTLARKVYENPYIKNYFHFRAWATVSSVYDTKEILVEILQCIDETNTKESMSQNNEHTLGEQLHKHLFGRRYLIVMDDVWDIKAWEKVRSFLPANKGSGIVITTRESMIASISSQEIPMNLLDDFKSWDLLCTKIFGKDGCPFELEDVGRHIANKCRGLPLSVVVIAGHLAKSPRTKEYWKYIAENLTSVVNSEDNQRCLKILSLSYAHLPIHLKPCFLYMGIFPEDEEIRVSHLIKLWVAEGFLKPICGKSPEEIGKGYLDDLIDRNLILPGRTSRRGKLTSCKIHDILRDLCVKEALKKKFFCVLRTHWLDILDVSDEERRIVVQPKEWDFNFYPYAVLESPPLLHTLMFHGMIRSLGYKLLRVLVWIDESMEHTTLRVIHHLVNLRCIDFGTNRLRDYVIPPSISHLWNLKYLVIHYRMAVNEAPPEIWEMPHLRHIFVDSLYLPQPPIRSKNNFLKNLKYARRLLNFSFSKEMVERIPNINYLEVNYTDNCNEFNEEENITLNNIACLKKLEKLRCYCGAVEAKQFDMLVRNVSFPQSLKKLTISHLHWDDVTTKIGSLPLLESLRLFVISGSECKLVEGQFRRLMILEIHWCGDLEYLTVDVNHFPCLQNLLLQNLDSLKEVPSAVGDIPTFREIASLDLSDSVVASVARIAEEQYELGNEELQVKIWLREGQRELLENSSARNFDILNDWWKK